ncbi:dipeptide ABC transporter ATP-binding protein [Nocardioides anomalus]|uniref:Dipeptide ABC transporter ATP-binding protein n=1 Tax=Nocardioides anomalus TaxID=2712223 RepID=A0A6G6WA15_9ACTN|nr:dipeptide ABC transporter ATP-binding protein [Nocardioides anomalus]QIG41997.1 dipeptide ABC transporter ATP-binding protein [Nocardioides anomalus]
MALIDVRDLRVRFTTEDGEVEAVRGLDFSVEPGETFGIVGESGSGKSVSTQALVRLLPGAVVTGEAQFEGRDLIAMSDAELRRVRGARIGMVFQDPLSSLHPHFKVGRQIAEAIRVHQKVPERQARATAVELLARVGLGQPDQRAEEYPHQFSGGMRQRAMLAMAVALRPALIIADEPTTALDVTVQAQILELLRELQADFGTSIIMITHDLGVIAGMADRVMTMYAGRMVETATRRDLYHAAHHPYTRGLLESIPSSKAAGERLYAIPGQPPSLLAAETGCVFRPRCGRATDVCATPPPLRRLEREHLSLCWLPEDDVRSAVDRSPSEVRPVPVAQERVDHGDDVVLRLSGVTKHFPVRGAWFGRGREQVHAVDGVDLEVRRGETLGVVGESGCGKSTLARLMTALIPVTSGTVELEGRDLTRLDAKQLRALRRDVQMVFQDPYGSLNPRRRVGAIIGEPLAIHGLAGTRREATAKVQELMELVGLNPEHYNRFPNEFSGGQRQRIGIARALATRPRVVVCDEPVSALDVSVQAQIINLLEDLQDELGLTYVFIGHDLSVVRHISDRTAVMYLGKIVEAGETEALFAAPRHHYTKALLSAAPVADPDLADAGALRPLAGEVPSPVHPPPGCRFHPRCARAEDTCRTQIPVLERRDGDPVAVACHFPLTELVGEGAR